MPSSRPGDSPITFVLGAGASMPYGLPSGAGLKQSAIGLAGSIARHLETTTSDTEFPEFSGTPPEALSDFAERLDFSQLESVDDFLENNTDLIAIGKSIIARVIGRLESRTSGCFRTGAQDNWLQRLNKVVPDLIDRTQDGSIVFVTFNYDRLVEQFFFLFLKNGRNLPDADCHDKIERLRIIHVHGLLGSIRNNPITDGTQPFDTRNMASGLRLPFEDGLDRVSSVTTAQYVIGRSRHVCFIGFGFHDRNLDRLYARQEFPTSGSGRISRGETTPLTDKQAWATTVGLPDARIRTLNTYFAQRGFQSKLDACPTPPNGPFSLSNYVSALPFLRG